MGSVEEPTHSQPMKYLDYQKNINRKYLRIVSPEVSQVSVRQGGREEIPRSWR